MFFRAPCCEEEVYIKENCPGYPNLFARGSAIMASGAISHPADAYRCTFIHQGIGRVNPHIHTPGWMDPPQDPGEMATCSFTFLYLDAGIHVIRMYVEFSSQDTNNLKFVDGKEFTILP